MRKKSHMYQEKTLVSILNQKVLTTLWQLAALWRPVKGSRHITACVTSQGLFKTLNRDRSG